MPSQREACPRSVGKGDQPQKKKKNPSITSIRPHHHKTWIEGNRVTNGDKPLEIRELSMYGFYNCNLFYKKYFQLRLVWYLYMFG